MWVKLMLQGILWLSLYMPQTRRGNLCLIIDLLTISWVTMVSPPDIDKDKDSENNGYNPTDDATDNSSSWRPMRQCSSWNPTRQWQSELL